MTCSPGTLMHCAKHFSLTKQDHPFVIEVMVVLPEHLHCLWRVAFYPANWVAPLDVPDFAVGE